ncbi:hypothetical protein GCM10022261_15790 [Brevibacterium daeguense]|uniref:Uncharacterized protein n=1 Tax=Brevibacterium daeguense TaxID=909936 RepID=A0ABP8EJC0_9MICO
MIVSRTGSGDPRDPRSWCVRAPPDIIPSMTSDSPGRPRAGCPAHIVSVTTDSKLIDSPPFEGDRH